MGALGGGGRPAPLWGIKKTQLPSASSVNEALRPRSPVGVSSQACSCIGPNFGLKRDTDFHWDTDNLTMLQR